MASSIVPGNVDGTYPKAGQDNSSQGMRDNFSATNVNFTHAKSEIEELQTNKAKDAVKLFDYIHSLDNKKLADALAKHQTNLNKKIDYFIQIFIRRRSMKIYNRSWRWKNSECWKNTQYK